VWSERNCRPFGSSEDEPFVLPDGFAPPGYVEADQQTIRIKEYSSVRSVIDREKTDAERCRHQKPYR